MLQLISVTGIGNFGFVERRVGVVRSAGGYISLYLHIGSAASVACVFFC